MKHDYFEVDADDGYLSLHNSDRDYQYFFCNLANILVNRSLSLWFIDDSKK